MYSSE
jgi:hypothetical protein